MASTSVPPAFGASFLESSGEDFGNVDLQGVSFASGKSFTPWVIDVDAGQDVMSKIMEFCEKVPDQVVYVISAIGTLSEITFTFPFIDKITYEGRFKIISLSGLFEPINRGGRERKGGVNIIFARRDGCKEGGPVVGQLKVANFVRVVIGTFRTNFKKLTSEESHWEKEPKFVEDKEENYGQEDDVGPSGVHEHETIDDANPSI
ncbi:AT-hook motif nuclear-localized protein [Heracleum sosnowskyi]|uniref:AT-hook motif nuclear-localized protein n=1 Tax=Heracleum sosnowskyi TaxID=360622 RepID=A0AAD8HZR1_9APIA|nr:AT-hook motif nuclear-localized protein [Heracleum sosnowskyi]